jgi:hypothetical protein
MNLIDNISPFATPHLTPPASPAKASFSSPPIHRPELRLKKLNLGGGHSSVTTSVGHNAFDKFSMLTAKYGRADQGVFPVECRRGSQGCHARLPSSDAIPFASSTKRLSTSNVHAGSIFFFYLVSDHTSASNININIGFDLFIIGFAYIKQIRPLSEPKLQLVSELRSAPTCSTGQLTVSSPTFLWASTPSRTDAPSEAGEAEEL